MVVIKLLYTTGDVARLCEVHTATASNWYRRGNGPAPDFITAQGMPLWSSLDGWKQWFDKTRELIA